jgi:RND family efflux transporter MFP subunit
MNPSQPQKNLSVAHKGVLLSAAIGFLTLIAIFNARDSATVSAHDPKQNEVRLIDPHAPVTLTPEATQTLGIKTAPAAKQNIAEVLEVSGIVKPLPGRIHAMSPQFSGILTDVTKNTGDQVKKGEVLARLTSQELARNLIEAAKLDVEYQKLLLEAEHTKLEAAQSKSIIRVAEGQVAQHQKDYDAVRERVKDPQAKVSPLDVSMREENLARAKSSLELKKYEVEVNETRTKLLLKQAEQTQSLAAALRALNGAGADPQNVSQLDLRAPADGVITKCLALPGQGLTAGQVLFEIVDFSIVQIQADVPESELARVHTSKPKQARIKIGTATINGIVRSLYAEINPQRRTGTCFIEVPNDDGKLLGEAWVRPALFLGEAQSVLAVQRSAICGDGALRFVFVESGGAYVRQDVTTGISDDQFIEIKNGLVPGDIVVIQGANSLAKLAQTGRSF